MALFIKAVCKVQRTALRRWVLSFDEEHYAVYLRNGGTENVEVGNGDCVVRYYNPRTGAYAGEGEVMQGPNLGLLTPAQVNQDWAVPVRSTQSTRTADNEKAQDLFNVYPNPSSGEVFIQGPPIQSIEIFGLDGKPVRAGAFQDKQINLGDLPPGLYMLRIISAQGSAVKRVVRQ